MSGETKFLIAFGVAFTSLIGALFYEWVKSQ